jgi:hypothetical protein
VPRWKATSLCQDNARVNCSRERLKKVNVELQEIVTWLAQGHSARATVYHCTCSLAGHHFTGSQELDKESRKQMMKQDSNSRQRSHRQIHEALNGLGKDLSQCTLPSVPQHTHETFQGTSIHVSHELHVKFKTKFGCTNPEFSAPVKLVHGVPQCQSPSYQEMPNHSVLHPAAAIPLTHDAVPMATAKLM